MKAKTVELLNAKETKFFACQGKVINKEEVEALDVQLKALGLAMKLKGLNAPEKHTHEVDGLKELFAEIAGKTRGLPNRTQEKINE